MLRRLFTAGATTTCLALGTLGCSGDSEGDGSSSGGSAASGGAGGSAGSVGGAGGNAGVGVGGAGGMATGYPAGPYGNQEGDTIPDLSWEGFVNDAAMGKANAQPFGPYSMNDLRQSGRSYALVHLSEFF